MKRIIKARFVLAVSTLLLSVLTIQAQDDGYMMTVELGNGTKLSLNTNEVKEISFAEGQIVVSGKDLIQAINILTRDIDELQSYSAYSQYRIAVISDSVKKVFDKAQELDDIIQRRTLDNYLWSDSLYDAYNSSKRVQYEIEYLDDVCWKRDDQLYNMMKMLFNVHGWNPPEFKKDDDDDAY